MACRGLNGATIRGLHHEDLLVVARTPYVNDRREPPTGPYKIRLPHLLDGYAASLGFHKCALCHALIHNVGLAKCAELIKQF